MEFKNWQNFKVNSRVTTVYGHSSDKSRFIKIELKVNPKKNFDLKGESKVIQHLNQKKCISAPKFYELGDLNFEKIKEIINNEEILSLFSPEKDYNYMILEYIPNSDDYNISDLMLSIIEQKNLGVYQGDIKPDNIRYDKEKCICYIIDYDQGIFLNKKEKGLNALEYFNFCSQYDKKKFNQGDWLRHFKNYKNNEFNQTTANNLINDGALNIQWTNLVQTQNTTNTPDGLYHSISHKDIFLNGRRGIDLRASILEKTSFKKNEKILDVGCNLGLLSFYLSDKGCDVTGIDIDGHAITLAKIINNIQGKNSKFDHVNIDDVETLEKYDTIMLFSVLHHTINQKENFEKINNSCKRIILEMRLKENGSQPIGENKQWINISSWEFKDLEQLITVFETQVFKDFSFNQKLGDADKGRMILEFVKK